MELAGFSACRFRYRVLTGMLAGTSASSLLVQITRLAWLLQEQAAGQEVAGGAPPPAADVTAMPPPPAPRGGEKSQRNSRAPWGQDILPGGSGGHREPRARAILNVHAPPGRRGAVVWGKKRRGSVREGTAPSRSPAPPLSPDSFLLPLPPKAQDPRGRGHPRSQVMRAQQAEGGRQQGLTLSSPSPCWEDFMPISQNRKLSLGGDASGGQSIEFHKAITEDPQTVKGLLLASFPHCHPYLCVFTNEFSELSAPIHLKASEHPSFRYPLVWLKPVLQR